MWYVLQTMSWEEQECLADCRARLAPETYRSIFVPQFIGQKHYKKEWHDVKKPLFQGYVFIDTDDERIDEIFDSLKKVNRLTKLLKDADRIAPVTKGEQEFLQKMMDEDYIVHYSLGFMIGERVCITEGPLRKLEGDIRKVDRHRRVAMLDVDVFGRKTPVEVGFGAVKRVSEEEFEQIRQRNIARYRGANPVRDRGKRDIRGRQDERRDETSGKYRDIQIPSGMVLVKSEFVDLFL